MGDILPAAVIICEGSKTEINYCKNFKKHRGHKLVICNHGRTDVVNIVKSALMTINRYDLELNKNDTLWAVFNCDENFQTQLDEAVTLTANKVKLIFSNPYFKFWYLLHYKDWTNIIARHDVIKRWNFYIEEYNKLMAALCYVQAITFPHEYSSLKKRFCGKSRKDNPVRHEEKALFNIKN